MEVTSATTSASAYGAATSSSGALSSDFETFLKMLTTQMQNQDPLNPMESSEFAVQLATFSGVEQQVKTNDLLATLGTQMGILGMAQLAGWVGMEARVAAPAWFDGTPVTLAPNPAAAADQAVLVVRDAEGTEVSRQAIAVSTEQVEWTGIGDDGLPLPAGLYGFSLESYSGGALLRSDTVEVYAPIEEARGENGDTVLILRGGVGVSSSDVTALRAPKPA